MKLLNTKLLFTFLLTCFPLFLNAADNNPTISITPTSQTIAAGDSDVSFTLNISECPLTSGSDIDVTLHNNENDLNSTITFAKGSCIRTQIITVDVNSFLASGTDYNLTLSYVASNPSKQSATISPEDTVTVSVIDFTDIEVTSTTNTPQIYTNNTFTYNILITNNGTKNATGITLVDSLPYQATYNNYTTNDTNLTCNKTVTNLTCTYDNNLTAGGSISLDINLTAPNYGGFLTNFINVYSDNDSNSSNDRVLQKTYIRELDATAPDICYANPTHSSDTYCEQIRSSGLYVFDGSNSKSCESTVVIKHSLAADTNITNLTISKIYNPNIDQTTTGANCEWTHSAGSAVGTIANAGCFADNTSVFDTFADYNGSWNYKIDYNLTLDDNVTIFDENTYLGYDADGNNLITDVRIYAEYDRVNENNVTEHYKGAINDCSAFSGTTESNLQRANLNIVSEKYGDSASLQYYFNLPTQITSRADEFRILAYEENSYSLKDLNTTSINVEIVDADSSLECSTMTNVSNDKNGDPLMIQILMSGTNTSFTATEIANYIYQQYTEALGDRTFYQKAVKNAKFRLSYSKSNGGGMIIMDSQTAPGGETVYSLTNFTSYAGDNCYNPFYGNKYKPNGSIQSDNYYYQKVPVACFNAGTSASSDMTLSEVNICLRCIFGGDIDYQCSADNFSIRPESFTMTLKDQNASSESLLGTNTLNTSLDLAAGYNYKLEVNATNHYSDSNSLGYTKSFNTSDVSKFLWNSSLTNIQCNDLTPHEISSSTTSFTDGNLSKNDIINNQVGDYKLNLTDTTWTAVDYNSSLMERSADASFYQSGTDCNVSSSNTYLVSSSALNGCKISSNHTRPDLSVTYYDYNVSFHPYSFYINTEKVGVGNNINVTSFTTTPPFVYMSDINTTSNTMAVHFNTTISAVGKNNPTTPLENFTAGCYAKPIDINITKTGAKNTTLKYQYVFEDHNASTYDNLIVADTNNTLNYDANVSLTTTNNYFQKAHTGSIYTIAKLNFARDVNASVNPEDINFTSYTVSDPRTPFNADLISTKTALGVDINVTNIKHYYGRTHARKQTYEAPIGTPLGTPGTPGATPGIAKIYHEVFCFGNTSGKDCNTTLLQQGSVSKRKTNKQWYWNETHTVNDGTIGTVKQKDGTDTTGDDIVKVTADNPIVTPSTASLEYGTSANPAPQGYPYITTMENNASGWLIYNADNPDATRNEFQVEFLEAGTWTGHNETEVTTKRSRANKNSSRRTMW